MIPTLSAPPRPDRLDDAARRWAGPTPVLLLDLDVVADRFARLRDLLPDTEILYAVKANPAPEVLSLLAALGASFDVASVPEVEACLLAGTPPELLSYGSTVKKAPDVAAAATLGVRRFSFDTAGELAKIARHAPGSEAHVRLACDGEGAEWGLATKFGTSPREAVELLADAAGRGLTAGISFHVGSQQHDPGAWEPMIAAAAGVVERLASRGVACPVVNLGGGFPAARLARRVPPVEEYAGAISAAVGRHLAGSGVELLVEPGRYLVADAGIVVAEVVAAADRGGRRWVYLDIGLFNGLAETMGEAIHYRIETDRTGPPVPVVLAGPTCDSVDVLYSDRDLRLPADLGDGDRVLIPATGAYTSSYATVGFNGFAPLDVVVLPPQAGATSAATAAP